MAPPTPPCPKCQRPLGSSPSCPACIIYAGARPADERRRRAPPAAAKLLSIVTAALALAAVLGWFPVSSAYLAMFAEFGGELPGLTRLGLSGVYPLIMLAVPGGLVALALKTGRVAFASVALTSVFVVGGVFMLAMYLPLFMLADNIR